MKTTTTDKRSCMMSFDPNAVPGNLDRGGVKPSRNRRWLWSLCLLALLVACRDAAATPTLIPPPPTAITGQSLATVPASPTIEPSAVATTLPAPPTLAPAATSTPQPGTATPTPTATIETITLLEPADFGTDRNPLTGELVDDPELLQRRPIAVKLSNSPPTYTRPQSGLNDADWVFEHTTEGAITRFTAIIYGKTPPRIGPIRSARLIDVELPAMFDAALAFSGASVGVNQRLNRSDFSARIIRAAEYGYFRTGENKPFEHTLYGVPEGFWQGLDAMGQNQAPTFNTTLAFSSEPPPGGTPAEQLTIDYDWTLVEWRYDPEIDRFRRWADGEVHRDGNSDEQVVVANVIVISPNHVEDANICEEIRNGVCAHLSVEIQMWGSGAATIFRDGLRYDVTWQRDRRHDLLTFSSLDGEPFPLQIGSSWVQVVPNWLRDPLTVMP